MQNITLNLLTDLNRDGVINHIDSYIAKGGIDTDSDGKITEADIQTPTDESIFSQDALVEQGYRDIDSDGKVDLSDKIFKDLYGDMCFEMVKNGLYRQDFAKTYDKIVNNLSGTVTDSEDAQKLNILLTAIDHLNYAREIADDKRLEFEGAHESAISYEFQLNDNDNITMEANIFNDYELYFLQAQGAFKLVEKPVASPVVEPPVNEIVDPPVDEIIVVPPVIPPPVDEPPVNEVVNPPVDEIIVVPPVIPPPVDEPPVNEVVNPPVDEIIVAPPVIPPPVDEPPVNNFRTLTVEKVFSEAGYKNTLLVMNRATGEIVPIFGDATSLNKGHSVSIDIEVEMESDLDFMLLENGWSNSIVKNAVESYLGGSGKFQYDGGILSYINSNGRKSDINVNIYHSIGLSADGLDHCKENGNQLAFEDLWKGGDRDFDDLVINIGIS